MTITIAFIIDDRAFDGAVHALTPVLGLPWIVRSLKAAQAKGFDTALLFGAVSAARRDALCHAVLPYLTEPERPRCAAQLSELLDAGTLRLVPWNLLLDNALLVHPAALKAACAGARATNTQGQPNLRLTSPDDLRLIEARLLADLRPSMAVDGLFGAGLFRRISTHVTRRLAHFPVTPNMVSALVLVLGLVAAVVASLGGALSLALGGTLFLVAAILDCCDGELARLKFMGSRFGQWFDTLVDDTSTLLFLLGVGLNAAKRAGHQPLLVALIAAGCFLVGVLLSYRKLIRQAGSGNHTDLVWSAARSPWVGAVFTRVSYLLKRDLFSVLFFALAVANQPAALLWIACGGAAVFMLWTIADLLTDSRHAAEPRASLPTLGSGDTVPMATLPQA